MNQQEKLNMSSPLINLFHQAEDYFFRSISTKCLDINGAVTAYMTKVPVKDLNIVYVTKNISSIEIIIDQCEQFYNQDNLSFVIVIPEEFCLQEMASALKNIGYLQIEKTATLAINLTDYNPVNVKDEVVIRANDNNLNEWMLPIIDAYKSTIEITSQYANTHKNAIKKGSNLYHFSLYLKNKPISSITLSVHNKISRIDDVGTLLEFQNKGYATRLVNYALSTAKKLGCTYCFLESSNLGLSIYQKLGFSILYKNNIYSHLNPNNSY